MLRPSEMLMCMDRALYIANPGWGPHSSFNADGNNARKARGRIRNGNDDAEYNDADHPDDVEEVVEEGEVDPQIKIAKSG